MWARIALTLVARARHLGNYRSCRFLSDRETIDYLRKERKGIVRFGDGEASYLAGYSFPHQREEPALRERLKQLLLEYGDTSPALVAIPHDLVFGKRFEDRKTSKRYWNAARYALMPYIKKGRTYGSAFCFRVNHVVDPDLRSYVAGLMELFRGEDLIVATSGDAYRGVVEPQEVVSVPKENAFARYADIKASIMEKARGYDTPLVLVSCGITATALAWELNRLGIRAYDVGLLFSKRLKAELAREGGLQG